MNIPCVHFWLIEPANGPTSRGRCNLCGLERDFQNCIPELADGYNYELDRMNDITFGKAARQSNV